MSPRRSNGRQRSVAANPVLVGAIAVLVVVVAVFLAYNANNGLPFVPTRALRVQVSNGSELVKGNEVRSGGFRVGVVEDMKPVRLPSGRVGAELDLKLDKVVGALPVDSRIVIRPRSALGLKYVDLQRGRAHRTIPDGGLLPASQATVPVDLDEVFNMFNKPTRAASQDNLRGFGNALAGRGADLNTTIALAPRLFGLLSPVMRNLADPRTDLPDFFKELGDAARIVAPISATDAHLFTTMADTFDAIDRDPEKLRQTIEKGPATLAVATHSLKVQRPFLEHTAAFSLDLNRAAVALRGALPTVNRALAVGTPVTQRSVSLYDELQDAMGSLQRLTEAPTTTGALRGLTSTVGTLQPQLRYLGPFVTVCNTWNLFWTFTAEHFTAPDATGGAERALLNDGPNQADSVTAIGANEFANGKNVQSNNGGVPEYLHGNTWGSMATDPQGRANCQAGQAGYLNKGNRFSPYGKRYEHAVVDTPEYDGRPIGPNYATFDKNGKGSGSTPDHVPDGETFTPEPGGTGVNP
jgi:virulence factor Mce-like protein